MSRFYINPDYESPDRYDLAKFMEFTDNYDPLTSEFIEVISSLDLFGYYAVTAEEAHPDLLSYKIYGDTKYWWILMIYNEILTIDQIETGQIIRYPSIDSIEDVYFSLNTKARG